MVIPSGTKGDAVRLAKFYPYPIKKMNAFLATLNPVPLSQSTGHNLVELTPGKSTQNRDIRHFRIGAGERRVWIHSGGLFCLFVCFVMIFFFRVLFVFFVKFSLIQNLFIDT